MRLYILRHGDAPYDAAAGERVLSPLGASETAQVLQKRAAELAAVPLIICSPVRRARETLSVLESTLPSRHQVIFDDCLRSESSVQQVESYLGGVQTESVLLISHQPLVGSMLNYLTDQTSTGMRMGTSCLACLELITFSRGCGNLQWLDSPSC